MPNSNKAVKDDFNIQLLPEKTDVFVSSPCKDAPLSEQFEYIKTIFDSYDPTRVMLGPDEDKELQTDEFLLVHEHARTGKSRQKYKLDTPYILIEGSAIFMVPPEHYACVRVGGDPFLLMEGRHVLHHEDLRFDGFLKATEPYLRFQAIHVLRVPVGQEAKMSKGGAQQFLLSAREKPYVFVDPEMQYHGLQELTMEVEAFVEVSMEESSNSNQALFNAPFSIMDNYLDNLSSNPSSIFSRTAVRKPLAKERLENNKKDNANQGQADSKRY